MADRITDEERAQIVAYLEESKSQTWVAKKVGRSPGSINTIAKQEGIQSEYLAPKKANEAKRDYAQAERLELLNEGFDKAREILAGLDSARDLQAWSIATGTLIDKRRLEDGEATNRTESVDNRPAAKPLEEWTREELEFYERILDTPENVPNR